MLAHQCAERWKMHSIGLREGTRFSVDEVVLPQFHPSVEGLAYILHKCRKERNCACMPQFHYIGRCRLEAHPSLDNHLFAMSMEVGCTSYAQQLFDWLVYWVKSSWNCLITCYITCGDPQHALILYQKMREGDDSFMSQHRNHIMGPRNTC